LTTLKAKANPATPTGVLTLVTTTSGLALARAHTTTDSCSLGSDRCEKEERKGKKKGQDQKTNGSVGAWVVGNLVQAHRACEDRL